MFKTTEDLSSIENNVIELLEELCFGNTGKDLDYLVQKCAEQDSLLTCKCIIYAKFELSSSKKRTNIAAALMAPYLSGKEYSKKFYSLDGVINEPDDMYYIMKSMSQKGDMPSKLTNAMKKGFRETIEALSTFELLKYRTKLIDIINLVHPKPINSGKTVKYKGETYYTIDAIMRDLPVTTNEIEVVRNSIYEPTPFIRDYNHHITKIKQVLI